jgi:hypothetical protein
VKRLQEEFLSRHLWPTQYSTPHALVCLLLISGSSTVLAAAFTPQQPLSFNFFTGANESWFEYPETSGIGNYTIPSLLDKPKLGIALSAGGFRYCASSSTVQLHPAAWLPLLLIACLQ